MRNTNSPIYKLHLDLLWYTFMMNTELDDHDSDDGYFDVGRWAPGSIDIHPLTTARWTSQVCSHWRSVIVESPSIWSNCIELDLLVQREDYWRNEVLKRTGNAGLLVSGLVNWINPISLPFFEFILVNHLGRIRKIDVAFRFSNCTGLPLIHFRSLLSQPAPMLNHIRLWTLKGGIQVETRIFFPTVQQDFLFSWTPQLRSIVIPCDMPLASLFSLLANMPLLESLEIKSTIIPCPSQISSPATKVYLPQLSFLIIQASFNACFTILDCVVPSSFCVLRLWTFDKDPNNITNNEDYISKFREVLQRYLTPYFFSRWVSDLRLSLSPTRLTIDAYLKPFVQTQRFDGRVTIGHPQLDILAHFLGALSRFQISSNTALHLDVYDMTYRHLESDFISLTSTCQNVGVIRTTWHAGRLLYLLTVSGPTLFPALHTLVINGNADSVDAKKCAADLLDLLEARKVAGRGLKYLNLACTSDKAEVINYWDDSMAITLQRAKDGCCVYRKRHHLPLPVICIGCSVAQTIESKENFAEALGKLQRLQAARRLTKNEADPLADFAPKIGSSVLRIRKYPKQILIWARKVFCSRSTA